MRNIEDEYVSLLASTLYSGGKKDDRTGTGTISVFGKQIKHNMQAGFPLLTRKKVSFNAARTELLWILNGRTDLKYLEDNGVKYWRPDYERSGRTDGTLGPVYGKQWRDFFGVDQLMKVVKTLREDPNSRRMLTIAWNPVQLKEMALPPCHYGFQLYVQDGNLSLLWMQRSADLFLGLPYDIAMYGLLLEMLAKGAGLKPYMLVGQLGDCHLYNNHIDQAKEYIKRESYELPKLSLKDSIYITNGKVNIPLKDDIKLLNYKSGEVIKAPLSVGL